MTQLMRAWRVVMAFAVAILLGATLAGAGQGTAHAATNDKIKVEITELTKVDGSGKPYPGEQLAAGGRAKLEFTFDASQAAPKPGDSFQVKLPDVFQVIEIGKTLPLTFEGAAVGECALTATTITCTFNDGILGKVNITGGGELTLRVMNKDVTDTVTFIVNDTIERVVPIPGGSLTPPGPYHFREYMQKNGNLALSTQPRLMWDIMFHPNKLKDFGVPGAPEAVREVVFVDTLQVSASDPNHVFDTTLADWRLYKRDSEGDTQTSATLVATAAGLTHDTFAGFALKVAFDDPAKPTVATITATGPFDAKTNYFIRYWTLPQTEGNRPVDGVEYVNSAALSHVSSEWKQTRTVVAFDTFRVYVRMEDGFGGFSVNKTVGGQASGLVAAGTKFTTKVAWTLPNGKTPDDYPGWVAPTNPVDFDVELGKATPYPATFPAGTTITLTEDPDSASPAASVVWGEPNFTVDGTSGSSATFTIGNQTTTEVKLENSANEVPKIPVTPTLPNIAAAVCPTDSATAVPPTATVEEVAGLDIAEPAVIMDGNTATVSTTASAQAGYKLADDLPEGWTRINDATAKFEKELPVPTCAQLVRPDVVLATCPSDSLTPVPTTATLPEIAGLDVQQPTISRGANGDTITAKVMAQEGYEIGGPLPEGWTRSDDRKSATFSEDVPVPRCEASPVVPVAPTVSASVCPLDSTEPTTPEVSLAETAGLTYAITREEVIEGVFHYTVTATPSNETFVIDVDNLPEGWAVVDGVVTFSGTVQQPLCAVPVSPKVIPSVCQPGSTTPTTPIVEVPTVPGLGYGVPVISVENKRVTITVEVAPEAGTTISQVGLPKGWTVNSDGTASFRYEATEPTCEVVKVKPGLPKTGS